MKHPHDPFPIRSFFLIITIFTLFGIPKCLCQDGRYVSCGNVYQCGNIQFRYPFWGGNRPENCGYPGFEVNCVSSSVPRITISSQQYLVVNSPDITANTVTVAREDLFNNICPQDPKDTAINFTIFNPSNTQNLTLYYGCPTITPPPLFEFPCTTNGNTTANYFNMLGSNQGITIPSGCDRIITVLVDQDAVRNLGSSAGLNGVLRAGFTLKYEAENANCLRCLQSRGQCGYDSGSFVCYCADRAYTRECNGTAAGTPSGNGMYDFMCY
ncbi:OLC1v1010715C1 [Oldenlandia corymbosa var. corymbosa]|uniref:non-specific serine/threonine protein kinase n=1 Tax=Oldenlandia corymbosa var. corymbosa TaxID=529605 RepID=A0AAV1DS20_OLDCO|nr:OLC1v1010715C1 [Oldenlandia corymbosa var. corymbosa]